jgi:DNA-binding MarR family transcriptional regulator
MLNLPYSTVYCQKPEVKERRREYKRKYYTLYYQRPDVKERKREYMRKYFERPYVKERMKEYVWSKKYGELLSEMMADLDEFTNQTQNARYTLLAGILRALEKSKFGLKHRQILRLLRESEDYALKKKLSKRLLRESEDDYVLKKKSKRNNILWELNRLIERGLVKYDNKRKRYVLTDNGRELVKKLYKV